jgi:hypothetical protein
MNGQKWEGVALSARPEMLIGVGSINDCCMVNYSSGPKIEFLTVLSVPLLLKPQYPRARIRTNGAIRARAE